MEEIKDNLEPYYDNLDHIIEDFVRPAVSERSFRYFEASLFKIKAIWYIQRRIETLDNQYGQFITLRISKNALDKLCLTGNMDCYFYFPFFEALEFENLLFQGKACLDCFSKAIGSIYGESPNNINKLINVLKSKRKTPKINELLTVIQKTQRLHGVIIHPILKKKVSIRDLITHRERINIFFTIRMDQDSNRYTLSKGALLNMRHPEISKIPNYLVTEISSKVWFLLLGIMENCLKIQFDIKQ
jgi:hypothetical protein